MQAPGEELRQQAEAKCEIKCSKLLGTSPRPARSGHSMTFHAKLNCVFLYGGLAGTDQTLNDMWKYACDTNQWSILTTTGEPPPDTFGHCACLLPDEDRIFVFGGIHRDEIVETASIFVISCSTWLRLTFQFSPPRTAPFCRWGTSVVVDAGRNQLVLFGGMSGMHRAHNDVTVVNIENWTAETLEVEGRAPEGRRRHTADLFNCEWMIIFAGRNYGVFFNDLWMFSLSAKVWVQLDDRIPQQMLAKLLFGPVKSILSATSEAFSRRGRGTSLVPSPRTGHIGVLVGTKLIVATGFEISSVNYNPTVFNDVFSYDLTTNRWTQLFLTRGESLSSKEPLLEAGSMSGAVLLPHSRQLLVTFGRDNSDVIHTSRVLDLSAVAPPPSLFLFAGQFAKQMFSLADTKPLLPEQVQKRLWESG